MWRSPRNKSPRGKLSRKYAKVRHRPLHDEELTEKHWMYRLAKMHWFGDFGADQAEPPSGEQARQRQNILAAANQ